MYVGTVFVGNNQQNFNQYPCQSTKPQPISRSLLLSPYPCLLCCPLDRPPIASPVCVTVSFYAYLYGYLPIQLLSDSVYYVLLQPSWKPALHSSTCSGLFLLTYFLWVGGLILDLNQRVKRPELFFDLPGNQRCTPRPVLDYSYSLNSLAGWADPGFEPESQAPRTPASPFLFQEQFIGCMQFLELKDR